MILPDDLHVAIVNGNRPLPSFPPYIVRPGKPNMADPCAECGGTHQGRAELEHLQKVFRAAAPLFIRSRFPLCVRCAATARKRGWVALPETWRKVLAVPETYFAAASRPTVGPVQ